ERVYKNFSDLYDRESKATLDVLFIAIEPTAHGDCELRAIDLGLPFMVEKPMTIDLDLADKVAAGIAAKNLVTAVGFQDRYLDLIDMIKDELPRHKAGGLVYGAWIGGIPGVWWWQKKSTCGGQLVEQNIHLLDGLRYLFGEPLSVYATCSRGIVRPGIDCSAEYDTDDHSTAVLRFNNSVTATLVSGCYVDGVRATSGYLITLSDMVIDYRLRNNIIFRTDREMRDIRRGNNQTNDLDRAFIDAVVAGDPSAVRSPYADALKTLKLGFAANESMETGKVITFGA
ncbi:MAG: Gfo/Idh/MocA family oxidoreductase, partial [Clostridiales bacterium]|nr:Gfo/Idh/MocA family oxidoreductase [Clostridiales bacterium]